MKRRKSLLIGLLLLACLPLTGGCPEAVTNGVAEGISDGLAAVIEAAVTSRLGG